MSKYFVARVSRWRSTDRGIAAVAVPAGVELPAYPGMKLPLDDTEAVLDFILST